MKNTPNTFNLLDVSLQEDIANFLVTLDYESLPENVILECKKLILDTLGVALATSKHSNLGIYIDVLKDNFENEEARVIGYDLKRLAQSVAAVNSYMASYLDFDSGSRWGGVHTACVIVPTALAVAESIKASGKALILGIVSGVEIHGRLGEATMTLGYNRNTGPQGVSNCIATAVTAGKILSLTKTQMDNAIGIAAVMSPMVDLGFGRPRDFWEGDMSKGMENALSSYMGILSAQLAKKGFIGRTGVIEAFCDKIAGPRCWNREVFTKGLGKEFQIPKMYYKPHAACMYLLSMVDCILAIIKAHPELKPSDIQRVNIKTFRNAALLHLRNIGVLYPTDIPKSEGRAKFSLPYVAACALIFGKVQIEQFSENTMNDPRVLELAKRIHVELAMDAYPDRSSFQTIVEIETRDGEYSREEHFHWGMQPENPWIFEDTASKFRKLATQVIDPPKVETIIDYITDLEKSQDCNRLTDLLY